ncbi:DUF2806 domain-containing protein [Burkholderia multivorans]|uniref:DUF2806 domain-containing protein n=1 Tax=Burkholderia multivorans TaxID=87883 RepID=UPI000753AE61|nr:DUF2806 domain-containing protein [Burkholderia multivorans]KWH20084.1 hypothetical protein WL98_20570 [Burkholderia multivorans]
MDFPGENLVIKMWDSLVDKGIGSFVKPWQARRTARADLANRTEEMLLLAQAERDAAEIRAGTKKAHQEGNRVLLLEQNTEVVDGRAEPQLNMAQVVAAASQARAAQAVLDEVNVAKSVLHAEALLRGDDAPVTDKPIDGDWLRSWRDSAARVSSDELQSLWGKILAGEVKAPGSCSLRTLDFVRNLSQDEAREIEQICPFVFKDGFIFKYGALADAAGAIRYEYLMFLEEIGLINIGGGPGLSLTMSSAVEGSFLRALFTRDLAIVVKAKDAAKKLVLANYRVTPLGMQVFGLNSVAVDQAYLKAVAEVCAAQGFEVAISQYKVLENGNAQLFNAVPVSAPNAGAI